MRRGLQLTMFLLGAVLVGEGLLDLAFPVQRAVGMGVGSCAPSAQLPTLLLGATWLAAGGAVLVGAVSPQRHPDAVRLARAVPLGLLVALGIGVVRGAMALSQVAVDLGVNALFLALLVGFRAGGVPSPG